jgi:hypothetical protein
MVRTVVAADGGVNYIINLSLKRFIESIQRRFFPPQLKIKLPSAA